MANPPIKNSRFNVSAFLLVAFFIFVILTAIADYILPFSIYFLIFLGVAGIILLLNLLPKNTGISVGKIKTVIFAIIIVLFFGIILIVGWYFFGQADRIYTAKQLQNNCFACQDTGNYISVFGQNKVRISASEFTGGKFGGVKVLAETKGYFISIGNNTNVIKIGYEEQIVDGKPYHYVGITKANTIGGDDSFFVPLEKVIETYSKSRVEISIQRGAETFFPFFGNPRNPIVYINGFQAVEGDGIGKEIRGDIVISSPEAETKLFQVEIYDTSFAVRMESLSRFVKSLKGIS